MAADDPWVTETVNDGLGFRTLLKAEAPPRVIDSAQDLAVFQNATFGKVMVLDGAYQITTADEFIYHEMMAHVPLLAHGSVRDVLIVGGGDGGIAREVLRHPSVRSVTLVEIDRAVVDLCRTEFPDVSAGAFDDPRLDLVIDDGAAYVARAERRFDAVIIDSPDPIGAGAVLFEKAFYEGVRRTLADGGIAVTQSGMPFLTPAWFADHAATLREAFPSPRFYLSTVPSYTGGPMAHGFLAGEAADLTMDADTVAERQRAAGLSLRYWTPALHLGAFALPAYVELLAGGASTG